MTDLDPSSYLVLGYLDASKFCHAESPLASIELGRVQVPDPPGLAMRQFVTKGRLNRPFGVLGAVE